MSDEYPQGQLSSDAKRLDAWVEEVELALDKLRIPARARRLLAVELQRDLEESWRAGADLNSLLDPDAMGFAQSLARANDLGPVTPPSAPKATLRSVITTALAGGVLGAFISWNLVYPVGSQMLPNAPLVGALILLHGTAATITVAAAVLAVRWRFRDQSSVVDRSTLIHLGAGFLVGGLLSIPPIVAFAATTGYSSASIVVLAEATIAALFCAAGIALATRKRSGLVASPGHPRN